MFDAGSILARLKLDPSGMTGGILNAQNMSAALGGTISGMLTNPILGAINAGKQLFGMWADANKADVRLDAVIQSTGQAAGYTSDQLKKMADSLESITAVDAEVIKGGQAILATFTQIKGDQFERATEMALNMSAVFGGDLRGSATQLGKALNDPINGISALSRVGVSFTEQEKEMIASMVEAGDVVGAQTKILDAMANQGLGGVAEKLADADGGLQKMLNTLGNLGESLGGVIAPVLSVVFKLLEPILKILQPIVELVAKLMGYITQPLAWLAGGLSDMVNGVFSERGLPTSSDKSVPSVAVHIRPEDSARRIADQISPAIARGVQRGVQRSESAVRWRMNRAAEDAMILT